MWRAFDKARLQARVTGGASSTEGSGWVSVRISSTGGTASGSRLFGGAKAILDQTVAFTEQQIGVPLGVTYAFTSFVRESDTEFKVDFNITAGGGAPLGDHEFQVEYQLLDAADNTLGPLTGNLFQFRIRITP